LGAPADSNTAVLQVLPAAPVQQSEHNAVAIVKVLSRMFQISRFEHHRNEKIYVMDSAVLYLSEFYSSDSHTGPDNREGTR
jgi:hypothetical protein